MWGWVGGRGFSWIVGSLGMDLGVVGFGEVLGRGGNLLGVVFRVKKVGYDG